MTSNLKTQSESSGTKRTRSPQSRGATVNGGDKNVPTITQEMSDLPQDDRNVAPVTLVTLIEEAQAGNRRSFDRLLVEVRPRALAVALKVMRNNEDAEDAVQEAFVKVWRYLGRFEGRSSFTTWLHRIVMNACLDLLRRQACRPGVAEEEPSTRSETDLDMANISTPEDALMTAQTAAQVREAIARLSPLHGETVVLRELEEHSYEEIAAKVECPVGTVMSRLHHARKRLAEELRDVLAQSDRLLCAA